MGKSKVAAKLDPLRGSFNVQEGLSRLLRVATLNPSRQLLRQYLRKIAYIHLSNSFNLDRRTKRKMAWRLATRDQFIREVANAKTVR